MRVLVQGVIGLVGRHIGVAQAMTGLAPALAAVVALPNPAAGDGDRDLAAVAGIDTDRMGRGQIGPAAHPFLPLGQVIEAADQVPAFAPVAADEHGAGGDPGPDQARLVRSPRGQGPDGVDGGRLVVRGVEGGKGGGRQRRPALAAVVGSMQLHPEMPQPQGRVDGAVARIGEHRRNRLAEEGRRPGDPGIVHALVPEQPLAARHVQDPAHVLPP